MKPLRDAVIVAFGRSACGKAKKGSLAFTHPIEYAAEVLKGVLAKVPQLNPEDIDDIIVGTAQPYGVTGDNVAKMITLRAKMPECVPAQTVNRFCSSGLQTIATASNAIRCGEADVIVAGGAESMSLVPMTLGGDTADRWLAENTAAYMPMGVTAENVAERYGFTRSELDSFAIWSHEKADAAQKAGYFDDQIIPVHAIDAEGNTFCFYKDEGIRPGSTLETLATLKTPFKEDGKVTAATSSQMTDGAGFLVLMSDEKAKQLGIKPIARLTHFAASGMDPAYMGLGPIRAVPKVMKLAGQTVADMDVVELNEAFASQAMACIKELRIDRNKLNPMGGALATGHPLGATGAILACKVISYLKRTSGKYGLITMCIGGGQGAAGIIEML